MADVEEGTIYRVKAELEDDYTSVRKSMIMYVYTYSKKTMPYVQAPSW